MSATKKSAVSAPAPAPVVKTLTVNKVCKNSVRYACEDFSIYIPNEILRDLGKPESVEVAISPK